MMATPVLTNERVDEIGEILSRYFIAHDGIGTTGELYDCFKNLGKRITEVSLATGISREELISFGIALCQRAFDSLFSES